MNQLALYGSISIGLYLIVLIGIVYLTGRKQNIDGYVVGNRNVGIIATAASMGAGWRDVAFIMFWLSFSYASGWAITLLFPAFLAALTFIAYTAPRFRKIAEERNYITAGQMVRDIYGPYTQKSYSFLILFVGLLFCAAQLFVMGNILASTMNIDPIYAIPVVAVVVCFYLFRGGYQSIILTDIIQFFVLCGLILIPFFVDANPQDLMDWRSLGSLGWVETLALMGTMFMINFSSPDLWQRIFSAKNETTVKRSILLTILLWSIVTMGLVYLGIALRNYLPDADPNHLFTLMFTQDIFGPVFLSGFLLIVFAMGMSTLDTWTYMFASTCMRDIVYTSVSDDRPLYIKRTRLLTIFFLIMAALTALCFENLMGILMGFISIYGIAAPLFFLILLGKVPQHKNSDYIATVIIAIGFILYIWMHFQGLFNEGFKMSITPMLVTYGLATSWVIIHKLRR